MPLTFYLLLGYLCGSILFAYYLPLWLRRIDITEDARDRNPGVSNCVAKAGWAIGMTALVLDLLKGALPVFFAHRALDSGKWTFALVMAAPVLGHIFPIFRKFAGGKGIAAAFGVTIGLFPIITPFVLLAVLYLFFLLVVRVRPNRRLSVVTFTSFGVLSLVLVRYGAVAFGCALIAALVALRHILSPERAETAERARGGAASDDAVSKENSNGILN